MRKHRNVSTLLLAAAVAIIGLVSPLTAQAQDLPSYARPPAGSYDQTIRGRIQSVDGTFHITVLDERGFVDSVQLHQGTIINPTGLTLAPGMSVTIIGYNSGPSFDANEIDAPYTYAGSYPAPAYYGPGWWYPGFGYGYGPAFSLGLVFVSGGYYYVHRPFYGRPFFGRPFYGRPFYGWPSYGYGWGGGGFRGGGFRGGGFRGGGRR
jgi:hypothetical protein